MDSVVLVVADTVSGARKGMGWKIPDIPGMEKLDIYIAPLPQMVDYLLAKYIDNSVHLFSGISGFDYIYKAFKASLKYDVRRALVVESPNTFAFGRANGKPLWLHRIKWQIKEHKNVKAFDYVFAMGEDASAFYRRINKEWKVIPFSYCTQTSENTAFYPPPSNSDPAGLRFCFVGSLSPWKAVDLLLEADKALKEQVEEVFQSL